MQEWIVVDQFGNTIAGPFYDKTAAEMHAKMIPNATVVLKNKQIVRAGMELVRIWNTQQELI